MNTYERVLKAWAKTYRESLGERIGDLIAMANADLHFGPYHAGIYADEDPTRKTVWPGFESACQEIQTALGEMPRVLWVNTDWEECSEHEPDWTEDCYECHSADTDNACDLCQDTGRIETFSESWFEIDRATILRAVVGKELANYV